MNTCIKKIKHSAREMGIVATSICKLPVYKDNLCKHHYQRVIEKSINWSDRPIYRPATQQDIDNGTSLKLNNTNEHKIYNCINGIIKQQTSNGKRIDTDILPDYKLFCVKT